MNLLAQNSSALSQRHLVPLRARRLVLYVGFTAVFAGLVQVMLGASLAVVALTFLAIFFGLFGFVALGAYNLGSWVALFYALGNVLIALFAKTLLGQALDSHLYAPVDSFFALTITSGALLAALLLVRHIKVGRKLFAPARDPKFLSSFSWSCFVLGVFFWLLNRWLHDPGESGFGGVTLFRDLLLMAVIARTSLLLERSGDRQSFDFRLGWMMATGVLLGLIDDSKTLVALSIVSHFVTVAFYRRALPLKSIIMLAAGALIFASIFAPMIHAMRAMGQQGLSLSQRVDFVLSRTDALLKKPGRFERYERLAAGQFADGYYDYFGTNGAGQMLLGRYASVQQIDPVIAEVNRSGPWGGQAVWPALLRLVPTFIYPDKPRSIEAFNTLVHYRLINPEGGKFPTLPLAGQAYAAYGILGLLTLPFITFFIFFLALKKLGWRLYRNIYAIFFFCSFVIVYVNQGDFGQYAGAALRNFPLFAGMFLVLGRISRVRLRHTGSSRPRRTPTDSNEVGALD